MAICAERDRLMEAALHSAESYSSSALSAIAVNIDTAPKGRYEELVARIERERLDLEEKHHQLDAHRLAHGC